MVSVQATAENFSQNSSTRFPALSSSTSGETAVVEALGVEALWAPASLKPITKIEKNLIIILHPPAISRNSTAHEVMLAYEPIQITGHEVRTALSAERRVNILLSDLKRHAQFIAEIPEKYTCHIVPFSE